MVITEKTWLPTEEELTVQEINLTFPVLQAAAFHLGKYCEAQSNEYVLCKSETRDPRKCLNDGKALTKCGIEFFRKVKNLCHEEFKQYYTCIDKSSGLASLSPCRQTQEIFNKCTEDKMNLSRPPYGYFCEIKVHDTKRPKPVKKEFVFEGTPDPKPEGPYPAAPKYGYFSTNFK